jgi:tetratricopeptide (TPR) repeat protein
MHARSHCTAGAVVFLALASALPLTAQYSAQPAGTLSVTTGSDEARAAFLAGLDDVENIFFERGAQQLRRALSTDPKLGIARAAYGLFAPGLTAAQRDQEINQGVADAANASTGELLLALAWRARGADRAAERSTLFKAAAALLPEDRHLAYYVANSEPSLQERVRQLEAITRRFPDYAPPLNQIAYAKNTLGDVAGALTAAEQQVKVAPNNPNPHDSYAELLQFAGRLDEAATHYQQAMALDGDYIAAHTGLAEVALLQGDGATARTHYGHAMDKDQVPQNRLNYRQAIAVTHVNEGNLTAAMAGFTAVAEEAEQNRYPAIAAAAHRNLAVLEAALGDKNTPHGHLAKSQEIGGDVPAQQVFAAVTHALLGHMAPAKAAAARYAEGGAAPNPAPALMRNIHSVNGIVAAAGGGSAAALDESQKAGPAGALAKALAAEGLKKEGKRSEAQALRDEVLAYSQVDLFTVIAKQRAKKI